MQRFLQGSIFRVKNETFIYGNKSAALTFVADMQSIMEAEEECVGCFLSPDTLLVAIGRSQDDDEETVIRPGKHTDSIMSKRSVPESFVEGEKSFFPRVEISCLVLLLRKVEDPNFNGAATIMAFKRRAATKHNCGFRSPSRRK